LIATRLAKVYIECGDWKTVVDYYDTKKTFFFFDPPYVNAKPTCYAAFSVKEITRLRSRLDTLVGK
jgi:site-specific DNA-adenine methylase